MSEKLESLRGNLVLCAEQARKMGMGSLRDFPGTPEFFKKLNDLIGEVGAKESAQNREWSEVMVEVNMMLVAMVLILEGSNPKMIQEALSKLPRTDWGELLFVDVLGLK